MKRLLLVCSMFTLTLTVASTQKADAQTIVTAASFNAEINLLNSQIGSGDTVSAKATFATMNTDMITVLGVTKASIRDAGNDSTKNYYINYLSTQQVPLYRNIWQLKSDMVTNRSTLIAKLNAFSALIY